MSWLVAHLSPTAPKNVYTQLVQGGHGAYVPTYKAETSFRGKVKVVEAPLVPRYVFLRYNHRWPNANSIPGVTVLTYPNDMGIEEPHTVSEEKLSDLESRVILRTEQEPFAKGELLIITGGNWTSYLGTYKRRNHGQGILDVDFMRRTVEVFVPLHLLARPHGASTACRTGMTASA